MNHFGKVRLSPAVDAVMPCVRGGVSGHEFDLAPINAAIDTLTTEMRGALDKQREELKQHGETTAETGKRIADIDAKLVQAEADRKGLYEKLEARVKEAEDHIARSAFRSGGDVEESPGSRFANSDEVKAMRNTSATESGAFSLAGSFFPRAAIDTTTTGSVVIPDRRPGIITGPERQFRMRDLLNVTTTESSSIEFIEETGFTNNAANVAEGATKPESTLTLTKRTAGVEVIAHWAQITRQIINDAPRLQQYLDTRMRYGLAFKEELQFLYGNGSTPNLQGIMTHTGIQFYEWSTGAVDSAGAALAAADVAAVAGDTELDALRRALVLSTVAEYPATGMVLNPRMKARIDLLKGDDGHYIWVSVVEGGAARLWRVPVVETNAMGNNEALVGAFGLGATVYDREETTVRITDSHSDYFVKNKLVMLVEERVALAIERPQSFVKVTFDNAPA